MHSEYATMETGLMAAGRINILQSDLLLKVAQYLLFVPHSVEELFSVMASRPNLKRIGQRLQWTHLIWIPSTTQLFIQRVCFLPRVRVRFTRQSLSPSLLFSRLGSQKLWMSGAKLVILCRRLSMLSRALQIETWMTFSKNENQWRKIQSWSVR